jgi:Ca-activated chloride channel family protein
VSGFLHPEWLVPAAVALLAAALALALAHRRAARRLRRLLGGAAAPAGAGRDAALLLAFAALLAALLGPRLGERERLVPASGIDLVLLVDVSRSMEAADTPPSRLARALRAADGLLDRLAPGDRAALAAFASRGALLTPLTPDHDALRELLAGFDTELIAPRGSALGSGVRAALAAFDAADERPRLLCVLSDGEDAEGGRDLAFAEAVRAGVRVLALGFGSEEGAMLPDRGAALADAEGRVVVTRRALAPLARLAEATGGELFRADAFGALDLERVAHALHRDAGSAGGLAARREPVLQVLPLAVLAFALLALEGLPSPRRLPGRRAATAAAALLLLAADPLSRETALRLQRDGVALLERGEPQTAARTLLAAALASRERELAALAYYHLGVAQLAAGELEGARTAFFDALALAPDDHAARFDLEWTLAALARQPPPEAPAPAPGETSETQQRLPAPAERREPEAEPEPAAEARDLGPDERERLLGRVPDDPSRALRALSRHEPGGAAPRAAGPVW